MLKIMKQDYVLLDFDAKDRKQLFEKISKLALEKGLVKNAKTLVAAFETREDLESTAFEDGFAIPHARSSVVQNAGVFFVQLKKPIIWDPKDNKLTDIAIMLVIPQGQGNYLDILSGIAQKLMVNNIRKELKTTTNKTKIIDILTSEQKQKEVVVSNVNIIL